MPVPDFITELRKKIGHDPLWLIGCTAVVTRPHEPTALGAAAAARAAAATATMRSASAPVVGSQRSLDDGQPWSAGSETDDVLLVRRSDDGLWAPVTGVVDPGEHPATSAVRETFEETRVTCEIERLAQVHVTDQVTHVNGDIAQYTGLVFRCRYVTGEPGVGDDESVDAGWWHASTLPPMRAVHRHALTAALRDDPLCELRLGDRVLPVGV